jgi:hypothetical protein
VIHWLWTDRKHWRGLALFLISAMATFWVLLPLLEFLVRHQWQNPFSQVNFMLQANVLATFAGHPGDTMLSRPWDWLIYPQILTYWIEPHYMSMISPPIWALIIPIIILIVIKSWRHNKTAQFILIWFAGTYLIWIPVSLIMDRMSYIYYFYPSIGAICIGLTLAAMELENIRNSVSIKRWIGLLVPLYVAFNLIAFAVLSPVSYWWKIPLCSAAYLVTRYYTGNLQSNSFSFKETN